MKFDFFTFGGSVFWEDVFFYQKWRIQRHCLTKRYRLLDSWDIRRASGSFEDCQKAFIKYIDSYEITKQQGKMVVLLHGYNDSKNIFKPLWRKLILTHSTVAAINYPSLFHSSLASAHQILFFLNHMEDISEVSFVTKGSGNLILQKLFNQPLELQIFRHRMRIGNIVEINPVIKENLLCELLIKFKILRFLFGPMLQDFSEKNLKNMPSLPSEFHILKIFSNTWLSLFLNKILKLLNLNNEQAVSSSKNTLRIKSVTFHTLNNAELLNYTVNFINNGKI